MSKEQKFLVKLNVITSTRGFTPRNVLDFSIELFCLVESRTDRRNFAVEEWLSAATVSDTFAARPLASRRLCCSAAAGFPRSRPSPVPPPPGQFAICPEKIKVAGLLFPLLLEELQFYLNTPCRSLMYLIESLRISDLLSFLSSGCVGSSLRNSAKAPLTCCWRNRSLIGCGYLQLARVVESDRFTCGYSSSFELRGGEVRPVR